MLQTQETGTIALMWEQRHRRSVIRLKSRNASDSFAPIMTIILRPVLLPECLSPLKTPSYSVPHPLRVPPLQGNSPWKNSPHPTLFAEARESAISSHSQFRQEPGPNLLLWFVCALSRCPHYTVTADTTRDYWIKKMDGMVHSPKSLCWFEYLSLPCTFLFCPPGGGLRPPHGSGIQLGLRSTGQEAGPSGDVLKYKLQARYWRYSTKKENGKYFINKCNK